MTARRDSEATIAPPVALVTGASSGIGLALARELARRGYRVSMAARRIDVLEREAADLLEQNREVLAVACDVTDASSVAAAVRRTLDTWGRIDVAIANAGIGTPAQSDFTLQNVNAVMRTNFSGMLHLFDAVIPHMLQRRAGRFVGIASLAGLRGLPGAAAYSASKAAMQTFLEAARADLSPAGIQIIVINPGYVATPLTAGRRHPMPFMMPAEKAARIIATAIERGRPVIDFPLPMALAMRIARLLPGRLWDAIARRARRPR